MGDSDNESDSPMRISGGNQRLVSIVDSITAIKENGIKRLYLNDIQSFGGYENKNYLYKDEHDLYKIYKGNIRGVEVMVKWFNTERKISFSKKIMVKVKLLNKKEVFEYIDFEVCFLSEVKAQVILKHENIVEGYGFCHENGLVVVHEAMPEGTLHSSLHSKANKSLDWEKRRKISVEIASAIKYLHNRNAKVLHRDITSKNVWLTSDSKSKLTSFMYAKFPESGVPEDVLKFPIAREKDPDWIRNNLCTEEIDMFYFGILLLEIATGLDLEGILRMLSQTADKFKADQKLANNYEEEEWRRLITAGLRCCGPNVRLRPSMKNVVGYLVDKQPDLTATGEASSININDMEQPAGSSNTYDIGIPDRYHTDSALTESQNGMIEATVQVLLERIQKGELDVLEPLKHFTSLLMSFNFPLSKWNDLAQCILSYRDLIKDRYEERERLVKELHLQVQQINEQAGVTVEASSVDGERPDTGANRSMLVDDPIALSVGESSETGANTSRLARFTWVK